MDVAAGAKVVAVAMEMDRVYESSKWQDPFFPPFDVIHESSLYLFFFTNDLDMHTDDMVIFGGAAPSTIIMCDSGNHNFFLRGMQCCLPLIFLEDGLIPSENLESGSPSLLYSLQWHQDGVFP